jgi:hypothetical protein
MDIDMAQKAKALTDTCRHCRKTGHWSKDCDLHFDIWYMDTNELVKVLEDKFATKDAVPADQPEELEQPGSIEGFVFHSR